MDLDFLLLLLAAHFVGDFAFQSSWMNAEKGKSWGVNLYHALTYVAPFVLFRITLSPLSLILLLASHLIIDPLKARYNVLKTIWQDQLLHIIILLIIAFVTK